MGGGGKNVATSILTNLQLPPVPRYTLPVGLQVGWTSRLVISRMVGQRLTDRLGIYNKRHTSSHKHATHTQTRRTPQITTRKHTTVPSQLMAIRRLSSGQPVALMIKLLLFFLLTSSE